MLLAILLFATGAGSSFGAVTVDQLEVVPSSHFYFNGEPVDAVLYASAHGADKSMEVLDLGMFSQFSFEISRLTEKGEEFVASKKISFADFPREVAKGRTVVAHALNIAQNEPLDEGTYLLKFVASSSSTPPCIVETHFRVNQTRIVQAAKLL